MKPTPGGITPLCLVQSGVIGELTATALRVLVVLMGHANAFSGATRLSPPTIGREAGICERNVRRGISELVKRGVVRPMSRDGRTPGNYGLTVVQTFALPDAQRPATTNLPDALRPPGSPLADVCGPFAGRAASAMSIDGHPTEHPTATTSDGGGGEIARLLGESGVSPSSIRAISGVPGMTPDLVRRVIQRVRRDGGRAGQIVLALRCPIAELEHDYPPPRTDPRAATDRATARRTSDILLADTNADAAAHQADPVDPAIARGIAALQRRCAAKGQLA